MFQGSPAPAGGTDVVAAKEVPVLSLIGLPIIVAAWAIPAQFLLATGGLIGFVVGRPVFRLWARGFDVVVGYAARAAMRVAESLATHSYDYAVRHVGRDH